MQPWDSLTVAEQTLMRRAVCAYRLAGIVQQYGVALRWAGAEDAPPPRSYTEDEQRQLVPYLADTAWKLADRELLTVRELRGAVPSATDRVVAGEELRDVLADAANWLWPPDPAREFGLAAPKRVREHWWQDVMAKADPGGLPGWDELSPAEQKILVCANENSGMLTGPFGIWDAPPPDLCAAARAEWVGRQMAPLLTFVRKGWIEVRHFPEASGEAMTVIPVEELSSALADPDVRRDDGEEYFVGVTCVFTYAGEAVWRGGWSDGWRRRLSII